MYYCINYVIMYFTVTPELPDQALDQVGGGVMRPPFGLGNTLYKRRVAGVSLCTEM